MSCDFSDSLAGSFIVLNVFFRRLIVVNIYQFLSSPLAGKRDIVVTIFVRCMCVRPCVSASMCASVRICPDHNLYNNAWPSKQFGTVVALREKKCHLKHFQVC